LFTGVIVFDPPVIKMENEYGEVTELSSPESPFGAIPLYQGFLSYKALPDRVRKQISDMGVEARKTAASSAETKAAIASIQEELSFKKDFLATARQDFPAEYATIRDLLDDIEGKLKTFIRQYRIRLN